MPLINCKVELTFKWAKHCVLASGGAENADANSDIIVTIKDATQHVLVVLLSAKDNQKLSKRLSKQFERSVYWNKYKTKSDIKDATNKYIYFLESNFA